MAVLQGLVQPFVTSMAIEMATGGGRALFIDQYFVVIHAGQPFVPGHQDGTGHAGHPAERAHPDLVPGHIGQELAPRRAGAHAPCGHHERRPFTKPSWRQDSIDITA